MQLDIKFIQNNIGLQDINIVYASTSGDKFEVFAKSAFNYAICPKCGAITQKVHDRRYQSYEHLPIWNLKTILILEIKRYTCLCSPDNPFDEQFDFFRKYQRRTIPYEEYIFSLAHKNTIKNAAKLVDISENTCQRIYNFYAKKLLAEKESPPLTLLGIDDISAKKGHNYNTVIYDQETGNPIDIIKGRTKKDVKKYFESLSNEIKQQIKAISMDMSRSYCYSVLDCFPKAKPVIDRFHIAKNWHDKIDEARRHIQNYIKKHENKDEVFNIRWAILKSIEDLTGKEMLNLILACDKYPKLSKLHYLKEEFSQFFKIKTKEKAHAFIDYFKSLIEESEIPELKSFSKTLDNWLDQILNYYDYPITNGLIEGNNHKIKNINRRGYGYRNQENFKLRVKLEFEYS